MMDRTTFNAVDRLSPREVQILQRYSDGQTTSEIATSLGMTENTVRTHKQRAMLKLEVHTITEAVAIAWRGGKIE